MGCSVLQFLGAGRAAPYALRAVRVLPWFLFSAAPCKTLGALPPNPCKLFLKKVVTSQWDVAQQLTEPAGEKTKKLYSLRGSFFTRR